MTGSESIYLTDVPLDDAQRAWRAGLVAARCPALLAAELVPLHNAHNRVTAEAIWARLSSPHYHASAMDGYAVRADATLGATETQPRQLLLGRDAQYIDTGDPIPQQANAVIPIEDVQRVAGSDGDAIEIIKAVPPWQYIRAMGEDIVATELVLPARHIIRPQDLGALAAAGHAQVSVLRQPRVAIIPTGSELVPPGATLKPGDIVEYNTLVLAALAGACGARVTRHAIVKDDLALIQQAVAEAMREHDLVIVNAGSSRGSEDFTSRVFEALGRVHVHGVAIRPGHPVVLGAGDGVALAGIPGYPVSAVLTFELFCAPLLRRWQGLPEPEPQHIEAALTRKLVSPIGDDEFVRVVLGRVGQRVIASPMAGGAGVITSLVKADGVLKIPRFSEGHHQGERVRVSLMCPPKKVERTILCIGSHDTTLDLLADELHVRTTAAGEPAWMSSSHVGSLSGLLALQRGDAHLAGCHLLDEDTGEYNASWVRKTVASGDRRVLLVGFINRVQGLMVPPGNPKHIRALADLARADVSFVNRQRGAGTRVLLDFHLKKLGIPPRAIAGYDRQEFTHLAVAAAVASGACDCGMGVLSAARALNLDFVPLFNERYDLVIPHEHYDSVLLAPLREILADSNFAQRVLAMGGYETPNIGVVLAEV